MKAHISVKWDLLIARQIAVSVLAYAQVAERAAMAAITEIDRMLEGRDPIVSFASTVKEPATVSPSEGLS